jgi:mannose-6-phosphate isomerase-like protein (cupin superfamily)
MIFSLILNFPVNPGNDLFLFSSFTRPPLFRRKPLLSFGKIVFRLTKDQFIRVEAGRGVAILDGVKHQISDGTAVVIPAGMKHNNVNDSDTEELKLYTLYSPPEHRDGTVRPTKADSMMREEHFDGKTTE